MKLFKKIISAIMVAVMLISAAPLDGFVGLKIDWSEFGFEATASDELATMGQCGDDVWWMYSKDTGSLVIAGQGDMWDYYGDSTPFYDNEGILEVEIDNGVTSIGDYAFYYCRNLSRIEIPDSVTSIGEVTFYYCTSLTSIEIPDSVTSIGYSAFNTCGLKSIEIPDCVTSIGGYAFFGCYRLTNIEIGNSVTNIGDSAFNSCGSLTSITVGKNNSYYSSDEYGVLFNKNKSLLIKYPIGNRRTEYIIPDSVTSIGDYAFSSCDSLTSVKIGNSVTSIGDYAFSSCDSLTSIEIPDSVTSISNSAFSFCNDLTNIKIGNSVTSIGDRAFSYCDSLTSIEIPDSVTSIGRDVFLGTPLYNDKSNWTEKVLYIGNHLIEAKCGNTYSVRDKTRVIADYAFYELNLISIEIPDSVTSIGDYAFSSCDSLTSVKIGNSVTSIGSSAFSGCTSLTSIEIPNSVTIIGNRAFSDCKQLTSVKIGNGVTSIGDSVFEDCNMLKSISVSENNQYYSSDDFGVLFNKEKTKLIIYPRANNISEYVIPDGVTSINYKAFYNCDRLESVEFPDSVTSIGGAAFYDCDGLISVDLSENLVELNAVGIFGLLNLKGIFASCEHLKHIKIPKRINKIGNKTFSFCLDLTSIEIPVSVTSIGGSAFDGCSSLTDVYYGGSEEEWNKIAIGSYNEDLTTATIHYNSTMPEEEQNEAFKLNHSELTIKNNATPYLIVSQYPEGLTEEDIVWTSSNERVACIINDIVHPVQYGKTLITASTKDGKYSASCEVTVQSSFVITSTTDSLHSIEKGQKAEYSIMLFDYDGNNLPVKDVVISNGDSRVAKIVKEERTETEIKLTIEGLKTGTAIFSIKNDEPLTFNRFVFEVYPKSVTYRADKIPVTNSKLGTNFSRSGMYVENFEYSYSELADCYFATMTVYNKNSTPGVIVSYTQYGEIYEIVSIKEHQTLPTDYLDFLTVLGKGSVDIATLNTYNYRYSVESTKSEIEIKVPENGYITFSNDILSCPVALVYGTISVAVDTAFQLLGDVTDVINYDRSKKNDVVKELTKKVTDYFKEETEFLEDLVKEYAKEIVKKTSKQNIVDIGKFSLDVAEKIYKEAGLDFEETLITVLEKMYKSSVREFLENSALKYFIDKKAIASSVGGYIKAGEIMFNVAEHVNVTDQIIDLMHSSKSGVTTITFGRCNEGGFVCKDVVSVNLKEEKEILDSLYLQHYQIYSENKNDLLSRPGLKELNLKENAEIEVHEITIMRDGVPYEIQQTVTVEIDLPAGWAPFNFRIYRVEPNGKLTDMHAVVVNGKAIFETDHFSEYIFVGEILDEHTHDYEETVTNPTCTEGGYTKYTCACGDSYTADETSALGHTESAWITDSNPTCTTEGSKHIECTVCEEILRTEAIPVIEHSYNAVVTAPTCTAKGYTTYTCACGDTYVSDYVAETDHNYNNSGICTDCGADRAENCSCNCHKSGFIGFIWKILRFFYKIFGTNRICDCGIAHY